MAQTDAVAAEIKRFLETGESDPVHAAWPGISYWERIQRGSRELLEALAAEVKRRTDTPKLPATLQGLDLAGLARKKAEPVVRGLFPKAEQNTVLALVERSVVFVTPDNIGTLITESEFPESAWTIANLYLASVNAKLLGPDAVGLVGLSEDQACYVSPAYFEERDPFADFVVHEVAHIFHNTRRQTAGLPETRRKYLLDIHYSKRETFAYACEAYSRILERVREPAQRRALAQDFDGFKGIPEARVEPAEVADIVRAACCSRNGWKLILARCAAPATSRRDRLPAI